MPKGIEATAALGGIWGPNQTKEKYDESQDQRESRPVHAPAFSPVVRGTERCGSALPSGGARSLRCAHTVRPYEPDHYR